MTASMGEERVTVEDRTDPSLVTRPGWELADQIHDLHLFDQRPAWRIGTRPDGLPGLDLLRGIAVPRLTHFAGVTRGGSPVWIRNETTARAVLRHRLALALDTGHAVAFEQLQPHDCKEWARLSAAALRDIAGLSYAAIADCCGYSMESKDDRSARRAVEGAHGRTGGRELWARLGARPWRYFAAGKPPVNWASAGGGPRVDASFATWATGRAHLLGPGGAITVAPRIEGVRSAGA